MTVESSSSLFIYFAMLLARECYIYTSKYISILISQTKQKAITNNDVAKVADIPTENLVVRFSKA